MSRVNWTALSTATIVGTVMILGLVSFGLSSGADAAPKDKKSSLKENMGGGEREQLREGMAVRIFQGGKLSTRNVNAIKGPLDGTACAANGSTSHTTNRRKELTCKDPDGKDIKCWCDLSCTNICVGNKFKSECDVSNCTTTKPGTGGAGRPEQIRVLPAY